MMNLGGLSFTLAHNYIFDKTTLCEGSRLFLNPGRLAGWGAAGGACGSACVLWTSGGRV
jgi:hypothetical protein